MNRILWTDGWDGYPVERRELTEFVRDQGLTNVVCLTGDRHAHIAGYVYDDFDSEDPVPVMTEFAGTGVSAPCRLVIQKVLMAHDPELAELTSFQFSEGSKFQPALNAWMLHGYKAALMTRESSEKVSQAANPAVSPHLRYMDTDAYGYYRVEFTSHAANAEFVTVAEPLTPKTLPTRRNVKFEVPVQITQVPPPIKFFGSKRRKPAWRIESLIMPKATKLKAFVLLGNL